MLYFTADPRDGISGASGASCNSCCCQTINMRPGETNLMTINYAPWSVPLLGGISAGTEFDVQLDTSACATDSINGDNPPNNSFYNFTTTVNAAVSGDLNLDAQPAATTHTYRKVALSGPEQGDVSILANGTFTYTPRSDFVGWDTFWYQMTDQHGRTKVRSVVIKVGDATGAEPVTSKSDLPYINRAKIMVNKDQHTISFAMQMPYTCEPCHVYRMTIKQPAQDCNLNLFHHFSCFDIRCKDC